MRPCLILELIVSDRQLQSAINVIMQHAKLSDGFGINHHIDVVALDATLQNAPEEFFPTTKARQEPRSTKTRLR